MHAKGTGNLLQLIAGHYSVSPLTLQGSGAARSVTASGVLADVFDIVARLAAS